MNDNVGLYFIVGALVAVVGLGVYLFNRGHSGRGVPMMPRTSIEHSATLTRERTP